MVWGKVQVTDEHVDGACIVHWLILKALAMQVVMDRPNMLLDVARAENLIH